MIYKGCQFGRRSKGKPRKIWVRDVVKNLKGNGIRIWKIKAQNKKGWAEIFQ